MPSPKPSSNAAAHFEEAIKDAKALLAHIAGLGDPLPPSADVFKRAGLVMALTAWETYVEDRAREALESISSDPPTRAEAFMLARLDDDLKRLHNPTAEKTQKIFQDYLSIDITKHWSIPGYARDDAIKKLDGFIKKRGEAVHRIEKSEPGKARRHLVSKDDLEKAIRLLKSLVDATDTALNEHNSFLRMEVDV